MRIKGYPLTLNTLARTAIWCLLLPGMAVAVLVGCQNIIKTSDQDVQVIEYEKFDRIYSDESTRATTVILDVRAAKDFQKAHIPGAINIPLPEIQVGDPRLAHAKQIVVYSEGWMDYLSRAGAKKLMALGYENISEFRQGLEAWRASHRRLEGTDLDDTSAP